MWLKLKNNKKVNVFALLAVWAAVAVIAIFASEFYDKFFTIKGISGEKLICSEISPDSRYEARAYLNNAGATTDYAVLVVLIDLNDKTEKNIFWDYPCNEAKIEWVSKDILKINDITLHVPDEMYDYRQT